MTTSTVVEDHRSTAAEWADLLRRKTEHCADLTRRYDAGENVALALDFHERSFARIAPHVAAALSETLAQRDALARVLRDLLALLERPGGWAEETAAWDRAAEVLAAVPGGAA